MTRRRRSRRRAARASQLVLALSAVSMGALAIAIVLDRSAARMGLLDRIFAWLGASAGARHARDVAVQSPLVIALSLGAALLMLVVLIRAVRR